MEPAALPATASRCSSLQAQAPNRLLDGGRYRDRAAGAQAEEAQGAIACWHLISQCLAVTRGGRVCRQARPRRMLDCAVRRSLMPPDMDARVMRRSLICTV